MLECPVPKILCTLLSIVSSYLNYQTPEDLSSPQQLQSADVYDFIIVGAGPSGSVLANRLSEEKDWKILLLEAGGEEPPIGLVPAFQQYGLSSRMVWNYTAVPDNENSRHRPRVCITGRGLGGGSAINNMIYNRGNRRTFDEWESMGNEGWGYDELLPYFKKWENNLDPSIAENNKYHSTGGPQYVGKFPYLDNNMKLVIKAFNYLGYSTTDFNADNQTGVSLLQHFQKDGERQSAARAFLSPIRKKRPNLTIVTNIRVTKVIINADTKDAQGIEYVLESNKEVGGKIFANKEIIVSAGAIASPQLLMLSGIGPKAILEPLGIKVIQELDVGKNFQNHIRADSVDFIVTDNQNSDDIPGNIEAYIKTRNGPFASEGPLDVAAFISSSRRNSSFPDIQIIFYPKTYYRSQNELKLFVTPMSYYNRIAATPYVAIPQTRGKIVINSTSPFQYPLIYPHLFSYEEDIKILIEGYKFLFHNLSKSEVLTNKGIKLDVTPSEYCLNFEFGSDSYWDCLIRNTREIVHHFSGTCKMGPSSDETAVVNPQLQVHKVKRLRVVDASIQPSIVNSNTNAIALTIGEKASEMIVNNWKNK